MTESKRNLGEHLFRSNKGNKRIFICHHFYKIRHASILVAKLYAFIP
jgi:hypothetical protein